MAVIYIYSKTVYSTFLRQEIQKRVKSPLKAENPVIWYRKIKNTQLGILNKHKKSTGQ